MQTNEFATKTILKSRKNSCPQTDYLIALDIGYSAVKGFSPNKVFCFPSFVHRTTADQRLSSNDIQYRDEEGVWCVGDSAMKMMTTRDLSTSDDILYARQRYLTKEFKILARTGIGLGMLPNEFGTVGKKIPVLQTGLPPKYIRADSPIIREAFSGRHEFSIRIGDSEWQDYDFEFSSGNIFVMSQPMGSFYSVSLDRNARQVTTAGSYFTDGTVVFDGGFGTLDICSARAGMLEDSNTIELSMKEVMHRTADEIYHLHGIDCQTYEILNALKTGEVKTFDPIRKRENVLRFDAILQKHNKAVCMEALEKVDSIYNNLIDYRNLIVGGGTGEAWYSMIKDAMKSRSWLNIVPSTVNDDLPSVFSNVRGYYMYRMGQLRRGK